MERGVDPVWGCIWGTGFLGFLDCMTDYRKDLACPAQLAFL